jgi:hypothetical protein
MTYSVSEQKKMAQDLINMYTRLASAKERAWMLSSVEARASWWPVYSWNPYLVWEKWPELFVPWTSGTIIPNNQITNNNGVEINISWVTVRNEADIQLLAEEIARRVKLEKNYWII